MKNLVSTLVYLLLLITANGQSKVVYHDQKHLSYTFRFNSAAASENNQVLSLLAMAQGMRPGSYAEINVEFDVKKEISRISRSESMASAWILNVRITRELKNRGFDLAEILKPERVRFEMKIPSANPGDPGTGFRKEMVLQQGNTNDASFSFLDSGMNSLRIEVDQIEFSFAPNTSGRLRNHLALIQNYYNADGTIQHILQTLSQIQPDNYDQLDAGIGMLGSVDQQIIGLEVFGFPNQLDLFSNDPIHFVDRLQDLKRRADGLRERLLYAKANLFLYYYNSGVEWLSRGRKDYARVAFRKSLAENPRFAPGAYQLAEMDFEAGYLNEAECRVLDIVREMDPDPETRRLTTNLSKSIYENYHHQSELRFESGRLKESLDYLIKADHLCSSIGGLVCDDRISEGFIKVRTAIYQSMITEAKQQYEQGNLDQTEFTLAKAVQYQQDYSREIPSAHEALEMWKGLRQKRYDSMVQNSRTLLTEHQYANALKKLEDASSFQKQFGLIPSNDVDEMKKKSAKPILLEQIRKGLESSGQNDLSGARKISREAIAMQNQYQLQGDPEIAKGILDLKTGIFSQECQNAQQSYDAMIQAVRIHLLQLDYYAADEKIREANKFLESNSACSLNDSRINSVHDSILPAVTYQTLIRQSIECQSQKRYQEMIDKYSEAGLYFNQFSISQFGLHHALLDDFATSKGNNNFLIFLADQYTQKQDYEKSLTIFRQLLMRNYASSFYKDELERLGIQLGQRDKAGIGGKDWKSAAQKYTLGDKRLKYLERGFKKGWKQS